MNKFPILYSRASNGSIQQWIIVVKDNSYFTESGQVGGKVTTSAPTVVSGKNFGKANATTAAEQALKDAQSKFDKQKKTGYFEDINEIDNMSYVEPMLAGKFMDRESKITISKDNPAYIQCKYNGVRCVANGLGLKSRKGESYLTVKHIQTSLDEFFKENPSAVLDGELFDENLRQRLNELMSVINRKVNITQEDYDKAREIIKYYVYDGWGFDGVEKNSPYKLRKQAVDRVCEKYQFLSLVPTKEVYSKEELWEEYDKFVEQGHEGAMYRDPKSPYENKRSKFLLKLKPTDDAEFLVTDIESGSGDWDGFAKVIHCKMDDGRTFKASFKGNKEQAKHFLDNKRDYIDKKYTIFFNGFTGKGLGIPNYAQFDANNSIQRD